MLLSASLFMPVCMSPHRGLLDIITARKQAQLSADVKTVLNTTVLYLPRSVTTNKSITSWHRIVALCHNFAQWNLDKHFAIHQGFDARKKCKYMALKSHTTLPPPDSRHLETFMGSNTAEKRHKIPITAKRREKNKKNLDIYKQYCSH